MIESLPDELADLPRFPSVDALYSADERRRRSPEWDYGVHWRTSADRPWPRWRVSWIVETGDLYAACAVVGRPAAILLGNVPPYGDYPHSAGIEAWGRFRRAQTVERVLDGWAEADPPLLAWVVERLRPEDAA